MTDDRSDFAGDCTPRRLAGSILLKTQTQHPEAQSHVPGWSKRGCSGQWSPSSPRPSADRLSAPPQPQLTNLTRTIIYDRYSGSMIMTSHLDHVSHCTAALRTNWSNRRAIREIVIGTDRDSIRVRIPWSCSWTLHPPPFRPGGDPGANGWFSQSTPIQMLPRKGCICGRLTKDLPST